MTVTTQSCLDKSETSLGGLVNESTRVNQSTGALNALSKYPPCIFAKTWKIASWREKEVIFLDLDQHFQHIYWWASSSMFTWQRDELLLVLLISWGIRMYFTLVDQPYRLFLDFFFPGKVECIDLLELLLTF